MYKILLLGGGLQGLSFGESFYKKKDYEVSVVSNSYDIRKSCLFKTVYKEDDDLDVTVRAVLDSERFDLIVPMGDVSVAYLSNNKEKIEEDYHVKCAVVDKEILSVVADKSVFMAFCKEHGFPHPITQFITESEIENVAVKVGFPSLIKPDFSVGARGITKVHSMEEFKTLYPRIHAKYGSCSLQEVVDNPDYYYNVMMYRDASGQSMSTVIKIVRKYPIKAGSSSCCIGVVNPELTSLCREVLVCLNWVGMADFDVLQCLDTMEYKIIEINPRVPASLRAAYVSGVDFPQIIVNDAVGKPFPETNYKPGKVLRYMGIDVLWFMKSPDRFKSSPSWFSFWGKDIFYQDIILNDRSTWYTWFVKGIQKLSHRNRTHR